MNCFILLLAIISACKLLHNGSACHHCKDLDNYILYHPNNGHVCIIFIVNLRDWCLSCWYCVYIIICHIQVKIGLICQKTSSPVGHVKYVSDMFTLCMWFLVVLDGIECKNCLVAPISTSSDEDQPPFYGSWRTHKRESMSK